MPVIGERGSGLVMGPSGRGSMPQTGGVHIEDGVEIGANSIDRGTFDDAVAERGAQIDDPVRIGHNGVIGVDAVIAGCTGIAGSSRIGARCMIGGGVGIGDQVAIVDDVVITAASQVPRHIEVEGVYSSAFRAMPARAWRRRLALCRALDRIEARLRCLRTQQGHSGDPT